MTRLVPVVGAVSVACACVAAIVLLNGSQRPSTPQVIGRPDASDRRFDGPPAPARVPGGHGLDRSEVASEGGAWQVRVIDSTTGEPVADAAFVRIEGSDPSAFVGSSDTDGQIVLPRQEGGASFLVVEDEHEIVRIELMDGAIVETVRLRPRPEISCVIEDTPPDVLVGFDFHVAVEYPGTPWMAQLDRALQRSPVRSLEWSGLSALLVRPARYGEVTLVVHATRPDDPTPVAEATLRTDVRQPSSRAWFRFVPELTTERVDVVLDARFGFPHDVEVLHSIRGPTAGAGGPPLSTLGTERTFDGRSNIATSQEVRALTPGIYEWDVVATGYGTFHAGRFRVTTDGGRVSLRNDSQAFVTGFLEVSAPETGDVIDVRVSDGGRTVTGHVFSGAELGPNRRARWQYTVLRDARLWAIGYAGQELCARPTRVDTTTEGAVARLDDWVPSRIVSFRFAEDEGATHRLRWLEVEDVMTGFRIVTRATQGSPTARIGLPEGSYRVRARWDGGHGLPQPFDVSRRTPTVIVPQ